MSLEIAATAAKAAWGFVRPLALFIACAAVGFGAAEAYEHRGKTPKPLSWAIGQGLRYQRDQITAGIPAQLAKARQAGADAQAKADKPEFDKWSAALMQCREARQADTAKETDALSRAATFASTQTSVAYRLGRASCGVTDNAQNPNHAGGGPAPGGVRPQAAAGADFRTIFASGAYTPARAH
jgi:hypothetical protein